MSFFKDFVQADQKTFLNAEEFAETHTLKLDGFSPIEAVCLVDTIQTQKAGKVSSYGLFVNQVRVFIDAALLPVVPAEGELVELDESYYTVVSVSQEMGIDVLVLEGYRDV